jgi:hypothetical protein
LGWKYPLDIIQGVEGGCQKGDDYRSVSFSILLLPSPPSVLLTSLRSAQANTHALIFFQSDLILSRINSHPTHIFLSQQDWKHFS